MLFYSLIRDPPKELETCLRGESACLACTKAPSLLPSAIHTRGMEVEVRACDLSPGKIATGESDAQGRS